MEQPQLNDHYLAGYFDGYGSFVHKVKPSGNFRLRMSFKTECAAQAKAFKEYLGAESVNFESVYDILLSKTRTIELLGRMGHLLIARRTELEEKSLLQYVKQEPVTVPTHDYICGNLDGRGSYCRTRNGGCLTVTNKDLDAIQRLRVHFGQDFFRKGSFDNPPKAALGFSGEFFEKFIAATYSLNSLNQRYRDLIVKNRAGSISDEEMLAQWEQIKPVKDESILTDNMNGEENRLDKIRRTEERKRLKRERKERKEREYREGVEARKAAVEVRKEIRLLEIEAERAKRQEAADAEYAFKISCPTKSCRGCKKVLPKEEFYNSPSSHSGKQSYCKACCKIRAQTLYKGTQRQYYVKNRKRQIAYTRAWIKNNRQKYNASLRKRNRLPFMRVRNNLKHRLKNSLATVNKRKQEAFKNYLGCSNKQLAEHIERQFLPGMTWDNYGVFGWHIDHIIPISAFDMNNNDDVMKCCHYSNLRPLWAKDNAIKGARILSPTNTDPISAFASASPTMDIKCTKFLGSSLV